MALTGAQCREARRLLGWNQKQLAASAGVYSGAVTAFERHGRFPMTKSGQDRLRMVRLAFEAAGVTFAGKGELGVNLKEPEP